MVLKIANCPSMSAPKFSNLFFNSLPDPAFVLDAAYKVLQINDAACEQLQIPRDIMVGRKCYESYGESSPCQNCPVPEVIEKNRIVEKELFRKQQKAWHLLKVFPIKSSASEILVGTISKDITSTKTAEKILVDFNYRIKNFIDRMPIGCILFDHEFRVSMWNPAAEKIFGYTEKEAIGKHPYEIIVPEDIVTQTNPVKQKLQNGSDSSHRKGDNITKEGRRITCSWLNTPVQDAEGKVISVLSMVQDVTLEQQIQHENIRSAQLASIGKLAANVAHEINNPISGVINYCELLLNRRQNLDPGVVDILERVIREADRVATIVRSLLNFAREPSGAMAIHDVGELVKETIELLRPEIRRSGIDISLRSEGCKPELKCNPQQIEQVLLNILKNAIDALNEVSQSKKEIIISCRHQVVANRNEFVLSIINNGPMIPAHLQEKIFEPFMTTKETGAGTGLGLGISLEIMRKHGGTIRVHSLPDEPVEMALVFPL